MISERPDPTRPARPTISPALTENETSSNHPGSDSPSTRRTSGRSVDDGGGRGGKTYSTLRPVISETISEVDVVRAGRPTATVRPSFRTVTRSPISRISSRRWEM